MLEANRELIARRAGRSIEIVAVSARDRHKDRGIDLSRYRWEDDMDALVAAATDPDLATQAERLRKWMGYGTSMLDLRAEKDFDTSDAIRDELKRAGVALMDGAAGAGTDWRPCAVEEAESE